MSKDKGKKGFRKYEYLFLGFVSGRPWAAPILIYPTNQ